MAETREVVIINSQGLHARPAAELVAAMEAFDASLEISIGPKNANSNSIMSVLALGATAGSIAVLVADGPDAAAAVDAAAAIMTSKD
jgi:phosphotransferase system HPr (HPr) family protein